MRVCVQAGCFQRFRYQGLGFRSTPLHAEQVDAASPLAGRKKNRVRMQVAHLRERELGLVLVCEVWRNSGGGASQGPSKSARLLGSVRVSIPESPPGASVARESSVTGWKPLYRGQR